MTWKKKSAFEQLFKEHYRVLANYAYGFLQNGDQAEDVVQDVFLQLWSKKDKIVLKKGMMEYLFAAIRNKSLDILRKQKSERLHITHILLSYNSHDSEEDEATLLYKKERLYKSIRQLPPKCQEVLRLSKLKGLTYAEIAKQMDLSVKTVENQMGRAMRLLRELMNKSDNKTE